MNRKLVIFTAAMAVVTVSCTHDRDEEVQKTSIESAKLSNPALKFKNSELQKDNFEIKPVVLDTIKDVERSTGSQDMENHLEDPTIDPTKSDRPK
nr:hypothetical protein [uncultured Chryseobacterium sp.]